MRDALAGNDTKPRSAPSRRLWFGRGTGAESAVTLTAGAPHGPAARRLRRQLALTRAALWAERIARAFWPLFTLLCLLLALALFGAFAALGPVAHRVALGLFALAFAATLVIGGAYFRRPSDAEVRNRLDLADPSRPLAALADDLAVGKGQQGTESAWRLHRARASAAAARLTASWPTPRLSRTDRSALAP